MGSVRSTTQNLQVIRTDSDRGLIMIKGAVPGSKGGWVTIKDAVKKPVPDGVIRPAALKSDKAAAHRAAEAAAEAAFAGEHGKGHERRRKDRHADHERAAATPASGEPPRDAHLAGHGDQPRHREHRCDDHGFVFGGALSAV